MTIVSATGVIQWTPTNEHVGNNAVVAKVDDGRGGSDDQSFTITVINVNDPPVITSTPVTTAKEGELYTYDVNATDPDAGDVLTYSLTKSPSGMSINPATGLIQWTPTEEQLDDNDVIVQVSDTSGATDTQDFTIVVVEAGSNPPVITSTPITTGTVGVLYKYDVEATDDDDDPLTFSLTTFPEGMTIDAITGLISWTPSGIQAGSHDVTVKVSDGRGGSDSQSFTIKVLAPTIRPVAGSLQSAGSEFTIDIKVENVTNLFGISFVLNYDTTYIDALSAEEGDFFGSDVVFLEPVIDDDEGTVSIGITRKQPDDGVDGSGVVAQVKVKSASTTPAGMPVDFTITDISANDPNGTTIPFTSEKLTVEIISLCVWPGDTDNNGKVDQVDVLPIGFYWELTGPARPEASPNWECQFAQPWNPQQATSADANGDGIANQTDVLPIGVNWGRTHDVSGLASDFWLQPTDEVKPATIKSILIRQPLKNQFTIDIKVQQVSDLFGIAFVLDYTQTKIIKPLSVEAGSFLGSDVLLYHNIDDSKGTICVGVSRKHPQSGVNGSGVVAKINLRSAFQLPLTRITIKEVIAIDSKGRIIPFVIAKKVEIAQNAPNRGELPANLPQTPVVHKLSQNFPNPFNPETWIPFQLEEAAEVTISIYDSSGKLIRIMNLGEKTAGFYTSKEAAAYWDGKNTNGEVVASGVYFYAIKAGKFFAQKKMIVVR
jgi:hypothetical protein